MRVQCRITVQDGTTWPVIIFMNIRGDLPSVSIPIGPKDVVLFGGIGEGNDRTIGAAPIIVHRIHVLNIMAERIDVDDVVARIIFKCVVMDLYTRGST